ncbi:TPA: hypothetical protein ACPO1V_001743 [Haemophilus influenzae]|uniref:hypothetical protein n=1 Tax=Haemophilus influenzae TaxID=727 RepID=UPI000D017EA3|nr:hypothetical protein [Haemophilus influenzae]PRJ71931.1 hypothetical protein BV115_00602 [Haemophilus influenzae]
MVHFANFKLMDNNDTFNHLLFLTGLNNDVDRLLVLLDEKGCKATKAQLRSWRRKTGRDNSRPIPDKVLYSLFRILFDEKNKNADFCQYPSITTK